MGLFGSSGIRGIVNEDLTPAFVEQLTAAVGTVWNAERVAIGRDTRISGPMFVNGAVAGFTSVGVDVERVGVIPTPGLQAYLREAEIEGCMITASHNPREYNGLKFFDVRGRELSGDALTQIEEAVEQQSRHQVAWDRIGIETRASSVQRRYIQEMVDAVDADAIRKRNVTVAVDPGHGAACEITPRLCRELGCRVVTVNATTDGRFPGRSPEPVPEVLEDLQRLVRASDADLGVAHDGDGDRAMFVDESGSVVEGDTMLAVLAKELVESGDTVVTAVNTSQRVEDAVNTAGGRLERTPIGSAQILQRITRCQERGDRVPLAGESNGGIFLPEDRLARDGPFVLARVLELLEDRPLSDLRTDHENYHLEKRAIRYATPDERTRMLADIEDAAAAVDATVDRTDGIRIIHDDGWVLARPSGTEPLIRISAEAPDRTQAKSYLNAILSAIDRR